MAGLYRSGHYARATAKDRVRLESLGLTESDGRMHAMMVESYTVQLFAGVVISMHLRLLKTFLAVVRSRNFTRAGEEVHLAQSSVSDQIQSLEADLGASLFKRTKLGLELTPAGQALQSYAEKILALADEARAAVQATEDRSVGSVTIGALETIAAATLPRWLSDFRSNHLDIHVRLKVAGSGELLRKLEDGEIDAAFCFAKCDLDDRFARRTMSMEPLVLVAPPAKYPASPQVDLASLAATGFVTTEVGCIFRHLFDEAFAGAGCAVPRIVAEVGSIGAIARLVAAGNGVSLVPRLAVADALDRGEVVEMPWPGPVAAAALTVIWRRRRAQTPALKLLLAATSGAFAIKRADALLRHATSSQS
jgi:DNA-binding transcriptional LysR family regulator